MSRVVKMHDAKTHLSRLVQSVASGREAEIVIAVADEPAARLVPLAADATRPLGIDGGTYVVPDDIDASNDEVAALFFGDTAGEA